MSPVVYARLTTTQLAADERDATAEVLEQLMPTLRRLDGFRGMIVATEGDGGEVIALSLWESEEALEANAAMLNRMRDAETSGRNVTSQKSAALRVLAFELN
jgi:heme-degrading monooxygenase HmoA